MEMVGGLCPIALECLLLLRRSGRCETETSPRRRNQLRGPGMDIWYLIRETRQTFRRPEARVRKSMWYFSHSLERGVATLSRTEQRSAASAWRCACMERRRGRKDSKLHRSATRAQCTAPTYLHRSAALLGAPANRRRLSRPNLVSVVFLR